MNKLRTVSFRKGCKVFDIPINICYIFGMEQPKPQATQAKPQEEKQTNCLACNKPIKKLKRYYRNGKFYCNKKCWRKATLKSKEEKV